MNSAKLQHIMCKDIIKNLKKRRASQLCSVCHYPSYRSNSRRISQESLDRLLLDDSIAN